MNARSPIYRQIQDFIRSGIAAGHFAPGDRLPSEFELARQFGTTRATVARAFQELGFEGLVTRRVGSGTYVSDRQHDTVDTGAIAGFEERASASGSTVSYELLDFSRAVAGPRAAAMLQVEPGAAVYRMQRLRHVDGRIAVEDRYLPEGIGDAIQPQWLGEQAVQHMFRDHLGLRISRIDNIVRATLATPLLAQRLMVERGSALLVREHVIFDLQNRPVLAGDTVYPNEFNIHYTLRASV